MPHLTLVTSKGPTSKSITLEVRASACEFGGHMTGPHMAEPGPPPQGCVQSALHPPSLQKALGFTWGSGLVLTHGSLSCEPSAVAGSGRGESAYSSCIPLCVRPFIQPLLTE